MGGRGEGGIVFDEWNSMGDDWLYWLKGSLGFDSSEQSKREGNLWVVMINKRGKREREWMRGDQSETKNSSVEWFNSGSNFERREVASRIWFLRIRVLNVMFTHFKDLESIQCFYTREVRKTATIPVIDLLSTPVACRVLCRFVFTNIIEEEYIFQVVLDESL